jgi:hypothetical protein
VEKSGDSLVPMEMPPGLKPYVWETDAYAG